MELTKPIQNKKYNAGSKSRLNAGLRFPENSYSDSTDTTLKKIRQGVYSRVTQSHTQFASLPKIERRIYTKNGEDSSNSLMENNNNIISEKPMLGGNRRYSKQSVSPKDYVRREDIESGYHSHSKNFSIDRDILTDDDNTQRNLKTIIDYEKKI